MKPKTSTYIRLLLLFNLPLQLLLIQWLGANPAWVERFYTHGFYKKLAQGMRWLFGDWPFPVGQLIFYSVVAFLLFRLLKLVRQLWQKKINLRTFGLKFLFGSLTVLSIFYFLFTFMWGLNYHRQPMAILVQLNDEPFSQTELENLCLRLINLTNESRRQVPTASEEKPLEIPFTKDQLLVKAPAGYTVLSQQFPVLKYTQPSVKAVFVPQIMSSFGIAGIYFPFTGEANVNMDPPAFLLPSTICHEMAHQIGVASEDEANLVSFLACRRNPEPVFQYSGNFMAMRYAMGRLYSLDSLAYKNLKQSWSPGVQQDVLAGRKYWESFQNPFELLTDLIQDLFLKANDQTEGLQSYSQVVELLMGEYRKNGLQLVEGENKSPGK